VLLPALLGGCFLKKSQQEIPVDYSTQGYVKAIVIDYELDGCRWMLRLDNDDPSDDSKKMEPDYLMPDYQKDSLQVWLKFNKEERLSICMAGETIKVMDIKKR
jgi:hypothetical protein